MLMYDVSIQHIMNKTEGCEYNQIYMTHVLYVSVIRGHDKF